MDAYVLETLAQRVRLRVRLRSHRASPAHSSRRPTNVHAWTRRNAATSLGTESSPSLWAPSTSIGSRPLRACASAHRAAQSGSMFSGGGRSSLPALDPLQPLLPAPAPPPGGSQSVVEYHAECSSADIASCVPACDVEHHGFELLATIDGSDTKLSCTSCTAAFSLGSARRCVLRISPGFRNCSSQRPAACRLTAVIWVRTSSRSSLPWSLARCVVHSVSVDMISS